MEVRRPTLRRTSACCLCEAGSPVKTRSRHGSHGHSLRLGSLTGRAGGGWFRRRLRRSREWSPLSHRPGSEQEDHQQRERQADRGSDGCRTRAAPRLRTAAVSRSGGTGERSRDVGLARVARTKPPRAIGFNCIRSVAPSRAAVGRRSPSTPRRQRGRACPRRVPPGSSRSRSPASPDRS